MLFPPSLKRPLKEVHAGSAETAPSTADFMVSDCVGNELHQSLPGNLRPHTGVNLTGYCIWELLPIAIILPNATKSLSKFLLDFSPFRSVTNNRRGVTRNKKRHGRLLCWNTTALRQGDSSTLHNHTRTNGSLGTMNKVIVT